MGKIGLITDFGTRAGYVASLKGVILSIHSDCTIVDLSHDISPQNIVEAALFLDNCTLYFPEGFIFLTVVDPGVGTSRKMLCMETKQKRQVFIAPDNGVLSLVAQSQGVAKLVTLENKKYWRETTSWTFHGRDIMAPVAAHVAAGTPIEKIGPTIDPGQMIKLSLPRESYVHDDGTIAGYILYADQFGNVITNVLEEELSKAGITLNDTLGITLVSGKKVLKAISAPFKKFYAEVKAGEFLCLLNSENRFEIAINCGSAMSNLGNTGQGQEILVKKRG
nr:SAM-dependent chlorinase/fluorinase [Candidatus Sigynarchaeota archaeon]